MWIIDGLFFVFLNSCFLFYLWEFLIDLGFKKVGFFGVYLLFFSGGSLNYFYMFGKILCLWCKF